MAGRSPSPGQEVMASARTAPSAGRAPSDAEGGSGICRAQGVPKPGLGPVCPQSKGKLARVAVSQPPVPVLGQQPLPAAGAAAAGAWPHGCAAPARLVSPLPAPLPSL